MEKAASFVEMGGGWRDSCSAIQKRGGQTTIHQMYKKRERKLKRTKCFHNFSFSSFPLHSLIYSTMFLHPSIQPADKKNE
jgi:hypothetical protein